MEKRNKPSRVRVPHIGLAPRDRKLHQMNRIIIKSSEVYITELEEFIKWYKLLKKF